MERTKRQLFTPFRFRRWARLAIVVMSTGEFAGGGGGGGWGGFKIPASNSGSNGKQLTPLLPLPDSFGSGIMDYWQWIVVGVILLIILAFAFVYVASVFRFVLFDSVLNDRCELRAGWRRWQRQGASYFLWSIGFGLASLLVMGIVIGGPVFLVWRAGVFSEPREHIFFLISAGFLLICIALLLVVASALTTVFVKDFVVPVMALEDRGVLDGWRRVLPILAAEKGAFTIYVLMRIGLAIGSAILFGIVNVFAIIGIIIPLGLVALLVVVAGAAMGLTWTTFTICAAALAGGIFFMLLIYVLSFISAPAMVFFQSYSMHFLGARYPRLDIELARTAPPPKMPPPFPGAISPLPAST
jgi:MFS family permease